MKTISMWKNVGRFTPLPEIAREDLPLKSSVWFNLPHPPPKIAFISTFLPPKSDIN